jgi:predicted dehydrogenase
MASIKAAVIGCGSIARHRHAPEYAQNPDVELVGFADRREDRARFLADQYGGEAYEDWRSLIARANADVVSVCTDNVSHAPITIAALEAGKHVLCEKPMATSDADAAAMIAAAKANGRVLMIGLNQRLAPVHIRAKELLQSGLIGDVTTFRTSFSHPGPEGWSIDGAKSWFFNKSEAFVGSMGDLGVHKIDLLLWLLGEDIVEASAFVEHIAKPFGDVDDNAVCLLRARSGAVGTMTVSWSHNPGEDNATILYGTKGILRIGADRQFPLSVSLIGGENQFFQVGSLQMNEAGGQSDTGIVRAFLRAVETGDAPAISGDDGRRSLAVVLACLESAETRRHVAVRYAG